MFEVLFIMLYRYVAHSGDLYDLIEKFTELIERSNREYADGIVSVRDKREHEVLVNVCLNSNVILAKASTRKIEAIKELRRIVGFQNASLKACKVAVEDARVLAGLPDYANGWVSNIPHDPELADHNSNYQQEDPSITALREKLVGREVTDPFPPDCEQ